jgi:hypothetical protein
MSENKDEGSEKKSNQIGENDANVKDLFISTLLDSIENSTSHGIPSIFKTKSWILRIFWLVLFIGALAGAIYCKFFEIKNIFIRLLKKFNLKLYASL